VRGPISYLVGAFIVLWIVGAIGMTVEWLVRWAW
jgi:hypothetical protein